MARNRKGSKKTLGRSRALQKITARFRPGRPVPSPDLSSGAYVELLDAVEPFLETASAREREALFYFLYQGAVRHNRWLAARPPVADPAGDETYDRFVNAFASIVPPDDWNVPTLLLWRIQTATYRLADSKALPLVDADQAKLEQLRAQAVSLPRPSHPEKLTEFSDAQSRVLAVIDGLLRGEVQTVLTTTVPLLFVLARHRVDLEWRGIDAVAHLTPVFRQYGESMFQMAPGGVNTTPTRWPDGETTIRVVLEGLVDCQQGVEPLQGAGILPPPVSRWPQGWIVMFEVVDRLYWGLARSREDSAIFHPLPSDLLQLTWQVLGDGGVQVEWVKQGSPGSVFKLFSPSDVEQRVDLRVEPEVPWHERCRVIADAYLRAGETRLGLFWLNVGVEALIDARIRNLSEQLDVDLGEILSGAPAYWDEARKVVADQMPDAVDRLEWPDTNQHVSVWRKLKYLHRHYPMAADGDDVMKHYGRVSRHRNALFHGRLHERLAVSEVEKAKGSFEWLRANLRLEVVNRKQDG